MVNGSDTRSASRGETAALRGRRGECDKRSAGQALLVIDGILRSIGIHSGRPAAAEEFIHFLNFKHSSYSSTARLLGASSRARASSLGPMRLNIFRSILLALQVSTHSTKPVARRKRTADSGCDANAAMSGDCCLEKDDGCRVLDEEPGRGTTGGGPGGGPAVLAGLGLTHPGSGIRKYCRSVRSPDGWSKAYCTVICNPSKG